MAHAWDTSLGDADVTILNGQVNAKLFFEDSKECKSRRRVRSKVRTWWFGRRFITDFGNGEAFRGLAKVDAFRKGPNGIEVIMFSNSIATIGLMRTVSKRVTDPPRRFRRTSPSGERASSIET